MLPYNIKTFLTEPNLCYFRVGLEETGKFALLTVTAIMKL